MASSAQNATPAATTTRLCSLMRSFTAIAISLIRCARVSGISTTLAAIAAAPDCSSASSSPSGAAGCSKKAASWSGAGSGAGSGASPASGPAKNASAACADASEPEPSVVSPVMVSADSTGWGSTSGSGSACVSSYHLATGARTFGPSTFFMNDDSAKRSVSCSLREEATSRTLSMRFRDGSRGCWELLSGRHR